MKPISAATARPRSCGLAYSIGLWLIPPRQWPACPTCEQMLRLTTIEPRERYVYGPKLFGSHGVFGSNQTAKNPPDGKRQDHCSNQTVAQTRRVR